MSEPTIICPKCKNEIKLNESLAAPLIESTKRDYEARLVQKDTDIASRQKALQEREDSLSKAKESLDTQVAEKMKLERAKIAVEESKKAKLALSTDLEQKAKEITDLQEVLKVREGKLAEAQKAQVDLIKKQRELDDAKRELDLTVEKRIQEGLTVTRQQARKEAEDELKLKVSEKEQTITSMQKQIEELKRRAEQGSQQIQGEVQELELEALLRAKFPRDTIEPVPKGEFGGDALQRVVSPLGQVCGTILWESKRTKNWSDSWLTKLRDDQRTAKAEIAVLVTQVLPKGVENFDLVDVFHHHRNIYRLGIELGANRLRQRQQTCNLSEKLQRHRVRFHRAVECADQPLVTEKLPAQGIGRNQRVDRRIHVLQPLQRTQRKLLHRPNVHPVRAAKNHGCIKRLPQLCHQCLFVFHGVRPALARSVDRQSFLQ